MPSEYVCIYHAPCSDGWAAAVVFHKWLRTHMNYTVEWKGLAYGAAPPDVAGKHVVMLDFSFPRATIIAMAGVAKSMLILDHHKTAEADLRDLQIDENTQIVFDMKRSGAGLAWDHFFEGEARPWWINYTEDRDLWLHRLPLTKEINAYLSQMPHDMLNWHNMHDDPNSQQVAINCGQTILAYHNSCVEGIASQATTKAFPTLGADVEFIPVCNCPAFFASDVGDLMNRKSPWSVTWYQTKDGKYKYSLRSVGEYDVSSIAKAYGGGGHRNAAGFLSDKKLA